MNAQNLASPSTTDSGALDLYAASVAILCLVHCLALPLLLSSASLAIPFVGDEIVHRVLVLIALPATAYVLYLEMSRSGRSRFVVVAGIGLALLLIGAFVPAVEAIEQGITLAGSLLLSSAHVWRAWHIRTASTAQKTRGRASRSGLS